ncbi:MAG: hypothetical protein JNM69_15270 [Archangium sp.]|nr:hypothetical protein [Archangium sp.]
MNSDDQALERLREFTAKHADQVFVACGVVEGALWLNTQAGADALVKKNTRWNPEAWVLQRALADWVPLDDQHEAHARRVLLAVDDQKQRLFPACGEVFKIVFRRGDLQLVGREKIDRHLSPDGLAGAAFVKAVEAGELDAALVCLERIENPNLEVRSTYWSFPLLRVAIAHPPLVEALIRKGASLAEATTWTRSVPMLRRLVELGAPLDVGLEPLVAAASEESGLALVELLIERGADTAAKNAALARAVGNGNRRVAAFLRAAGAT